MGNVNITKVKPILLKPAPNKCQDCAVDHKPEMPHDATSIYYQVKFKIDRNRGATWEDAMEHCNDDIKNHWRIELGKIGIDTTSKNVTGEKNENGNPR